MILTDYANPIGFRGSYKDSKNFLAKIPGGKFLKKVAEITHGIMKDSSTRKETMFRRRHLQVRLVKDEVIDPNAAANAQERFHVKVLVIKESAKELLKTGAAAVILYIVADTARQVLVEQAKK